MKDGIAARRKQIWNISLPIFVELLMGTLFGMVDMIMIGQSGTGPEVTASIAAIGITNQYMFIGLSLVSALTTGATAMIARYIGAKQEERIESVFRHALILTMLLLSLPIVILGLMKAEGIMAFIGAEADAIFVGKPYFIAIMVGFIFQAFNYVVFASMRGAADTKSPMHINMIVNILNVVGNAILIFGLFGFPKLGVTGAGISTAFAQIVASIFCLKYLLSGKHRVKLSKEGSFKFNKGILHNLILIGVPAAIEQVFFRLGILLYVRTVAGLGTVVYATHQLALNILSLSFTIGQAFGTAASTLVGRSLGAEDSEEAKNYMKETKNYAVYISLLVAFLFFFLSKYIVRLYTSDKEIIDMASGVLKMVAIIQPFQASQFVSAGGLRGAGDTRFTLISTGVGVLIVRNIAAWFLVLFKGFGLTGAWMALMIDQFIRWILIRYRVGSGKWKDIELY